jgi:flagellin
MGFVINTNSNAMTASTNSVGTNRELSSSLNKLASGLRINKAADDASGLAIADSLRSQVSGLKQAVRNANDAIGIIQIADKAMDEQIKILDTIRVKAIQSAQDGQTTQSRKALQSDVARLLEELDNIATTTSYNGKSLLSGGFTNKKFQIGAYSNETVKASIGATSSDKIGQTRFETGAPITASTQISLRFENVDGVNDIDLEAVIISTTAGTGLGALVEIINKNSNDLQARAKAEVKLTGQNKVGDKGGGNTILGLKINGLTLGDIYDVQPNDRDAKIVAAINNVTADTGVIAAIDGAGKIELTTLDQRGIMISAEKGLDILGIPGATQGPSSYEFYGRLTVIRNDARDIIVKKIDGENPTSADDIGFGVNGSAHSPAETVINLRSIRGSFTRDQASAMGAHANFYDSLFHQTKKNGSMPTGVTTFTGSQTVIDIADTATRMLDKIRADLGSVQIQLEATVNNITTTRTNIKFSESQIRDVDYSEEISNFKKTNLLAQAGNYALSQSHGVAQNVLKLLQ